MRRVQFDHNGKHYEVIVRYDHPALVYEVHRIGNKENIDLIASISPFHSESDDETVRRLVKKHLD